MSAYCAKVATRSLGNIDLDSEAPLCSFTELRGIGLPERDSRSRCCALGLSSRKGVPRYPRGKKLQGLAQATAWRSPNMSHVNEDGEEFFNCMLLGGFGEAAALLVG